MSVRVRPSLFLVVLMTEGTPMQRIVDLRKKPKAPYIYCGRGMPYSPVGPVAASPLQNPFWVGKHGNDAIPLFRKRLFELIKAKDRSVMALMSAIGRDTTLACWCTTIAGEAIYADHEVCHCQVIFKANRYLLRAGVLVPATNREVSHEANQGQDAIR